MKSIIAAWAGALGLALSSAAHEFWLEPAKFNPTPGEIVQVALFVGERFAGEPFVRDDAHFRRFELLTNVGASKVLGRSGAAPAGMTRLTTPGLGILVYESHPRLSELAAERFEAYLREEGLESIIPQRAALGEAQKAGSEAYSRCAKSILYSGAPQPLAGFDRVVGLTLEIIPLENPVIQPAANFLPVRVLFRGQPLPDARVVAINRGGPSQLRETRTNAAGEARVPLDRDGVWMLTTIHMTRAPTAAEADWESYWSSLTFETTRPATDAAAAP